MRSLRYVAFTVAGLTIVGAAQAQLVWCFKFGPGNSRAAYADGVNVNDGQNVLVDHTDVVSQGVAAGQTHTLNLSVWIQNTGTTAVSTTNGVTANTLVGIDSSDGSGVGRTQKVLPVGAVGNFAGDPTGATYGAWGYHPTIQGPAGNVAWAAGANGTATAASSRAWGYFVSLNNTVNFSIAPGAEIRLFNFTIKNNTLGNGGATLANPQMISIFDAGTGSSNTTLFRQNSTSTNYRPGGNTANSTGNNNARGSYRAFNVVPEPGTMLALAAGLGALMARRRRSK
ncbi:MAG TPA: PEP-CTERM sorting domain-containing protein [Fimbriimonadaceae bacterium]|nr:PEP-CTERM sorting domain-containing protein [Fimbriimonadaceae bacterium]